LEELHQCDKNQPRDVFDSYCPTVLQQSQHYENKDGTQRYRYDNF